MSHFRLLHGCQSCSNWSPWRSTYKNGEDRVTGFIAVFSDDWDWSFNSLKHHSCRQQPLNRISQFSAVFSDDWKDSGIEALPQVSFAANNVGRLFNQQNCQSLSPSVDSNDVANDIQQYVTLSRRLCSWQCRERYSPPISRQKHHSRAHIRSQLGWLERIEVEERQPSSASSRESTETIIPSAASVSDTWRTRSAAATDVESMTNLPSSALPGLNMAINMATLTTTERNIFIALAPSDLKDPCALMELVTKDREKMMCGLTPDWSPIWEGGVEENEPDWHQDVEGNIELDDEIMYEREEGLENLPETTFEILFEEFINY